MDRARACGRSGPGSRAPIELSSSVVHTCPPAYCLPLGLRRNAPYLNAAHTELRQFPLHSVTAVPPHWVRTKPGASYLVCPTEPDVCIPVRDGYALTVLVRWMAWETEPRSAAAYLDCPVGQTGTVWRADTVAEPRQSVMRPPR